MRHHNKNRKFGRETGQRHALLRSLARSLILRGRIRTTEAKAKSLRPVVEKMITAARRGDLAARRLAAARLASPAATKVLLETIAPRYASRAGGYTRIVKLPPRTVDRAKMALIEFV